MCRGNARSDVKRKFNIDLPLPHKGVFRGIEDNSLSRLCGFVSEVYFVYSNEQKRARYDENFSRFSPEQVASVYIHLHYLPIPFSIADKGSIVIAVS